MRRTLECPEGHLDPLSHLASASSPVACTVNPLLLDRLPGPPWTVHHGLSPLPAGQATRAPFREANRPHMSTPTRQCPWFIQTS